MKNVFSFTIMFLFLGIIYSFSDNTNHTKSEVEDKIKWYTWEEAVEANKKEPRKLVIDVYTDWCHWCKVMDKNTFGDKDITTYINKHFYAVKFNAEQKEAITWNGQKFEFVATGKRGVHTLAYSLLDGQMSYPTTVVMTEKFERIGIFKGYKQPAQMMKALEYAAEGFYKTTEWKDFEGAPAKN